LSVHRTIQRCIINNFMMSQMFSGHLNMLEVWPCGSKSFKMTMVSKGMDTRTRYRLGRFKDLIFCREVEISHRGFKEDGTMREPEFVRIDWNEVPA